VKAKNLEELKALIEKHSKRCPFCFSTKLTSLGGFDDIPLMHKCLGCKCQFPDEEALPPELQAINPSASFAYTSPTIENIFSRHKRGSNGN